MNSDKYKKQLLKIEKLEVGMAVLKSEQTRVVASYIEIISTYVYSTSLRLLTEYTTLVVLVNRSKIVVSHNLTSLKSKRRDVLYTYVLIISI